MGIKALKRTWNAFGKMDPLWAILSLPDKKGKKWQLDEFFESGVKEIDAVIQYIESLNITIQRRRALDFGCGVGRLTQALAYHFNQVSGVDIAPSMLELARKYNKHGNKCTYHLNEAADLNLFSDNGFDFIYSNITLQHMEPQFSKKYIKEFLRILTPQGLILFQHPSEPITKVLARKQAKLKLQITAHKILPAFILKLLGKEPVMECYGIKKEELLDFLKMHGATIVDIEPDQNTPGWISFRYCITKS